MEYFKNYTLFPRVLVYHDNEEFDLDDTRTLFFDLNKTDYFSIYWNMNKKEYTSQKHYDNEDYSYEELNKTMLFLK